MSTIRRLPKLLDLSQNQHNGKRIAATRAMILFISFYYDLLHSMVSEHFSSQFKDVLFRIAVQLH
jgi:hypothetical protein